MKLTFPSPPLLMSLPLLIVLFRFPVALGAKTNEEAPHRAQVLILGAGAAGNSATKYIHDHGVKDFVIIDAENRIGGRVKASEFGGKIVDPLWDLAKNLTTLSQRNDNAVSESCKATPSNSYPDFPKISKWHLTMGTYTKIFMRFNASAQRFWDDEEYILYAHPTRGYYAMWQNLEAVGLHPAGTNILLVSVFDDEADRVSRLPVATVKAELTAVLRSMYGAQVPEPVEILVHDWHTSPLYYGSFSNWPPWMSADTHALMGASLNHTLYFAGEAYSAGYYGYLHGAMHSGNQTAQQIISSMGLKSA
ncbi:uncharacterized protein LOC141914568 [Tubulanus polymorphus]|uniref:uncharacterized protein LOC141914568 n=1 Tax=Tubulanus polymorphus TaxID=672921 RepID=UPI003DA2ACB4